MLNSLSNTYGLLCLFRVWRLCFGFFFYLFRDTSYLSTWSRSTSLFGSPSVFYPFILFVSTSRCLQSSRCPHFNSTQQPTHVVWPLQHEIIGCAHCEALRFDLALPAPGILAPTCLHAQAAYDPPGCGVTAFSDGSNLLNGHKCVILCVIQFISHDEKHLLTRYTELF